MSRTLLVRRDGDALYVGDARVTVEFTQEGRALIRVDAPEGVRVVPAEVAEAVRPHEPARKGRASA